MQKILIGMTITCAALMGVGCSSRNFMVYKDGSNFYITSGCSELKRILCASGDMGRIVKDSELSDSLQKKLEVGICTADKDRKKLMETLKGMTKEQHAALKDAFRRNGYEINKPVDS